MNFDTLTVGTNVAIIPPHSPREKSLAIFDEAIFNKVTKVTKTLIVVGDRRFLKSTGRQKGFPTGWSLASVAEGQRYSTKVRAARTRERLLAKINEIDFQELSNLEMQGILKVVMTR